LVCELVTSTNQIKQATPTFQLVVASVSKNYVSSFNDKSSAMLKLVVASISNNNALSFNDKSSSMFKLVVASITNEFSKGSTNDSPAKQCPVSNDDPAIETFLQLHVPMIKASIWQFIVALTFERSIEAFPIFQLIDVSILDENDSFCVFQMVAHWHSTFSQSTSFNDSSFQLVVKSEFDVSHSVGARASPTTKFNYSEISFHFCKDFRIFHEGEWEWDVKDDGDAVIKRQSAKEIYNWYYLFL